MSLFSSLDPESNSDTQLHERVQKLEALGVLRMWRVAHQTRIMAGPLYFMELIALFDTKAIPDNAYADFNLGLIRFPVMMLAKERELFETWETELDDIERECWD